MSTPTIQRHLTCIRDGFKKVDAITRQLGMEPDQEQLEAALLKRESIVKAEIDSPAKELTAAYPDWQATARSDGRLRGLIDEAEDLMRSILRGDEFLATVLRRRMDVLQAKMGSLYQSSRVAYSYISNSRGTACCAPAKKEPLSLCQH